ncbi:MAG TPA: hypothetical protein VJL29_08560 [Thermoguttaceae bacterium]|nr:hypothetical protein [Thermoguttaceae bacterium]
MKRLITTVCLTALLGIVLPQSVHAASSKKSSSPSIFSPAGVSNTFRSIGSGTTKFVQGAVDLVTPKSMRKKSTSRLHQPSKPWMNNTSRRNKPKEKKSFWSSLLPAKEEPKKVKTMKEFVGLERPN